MEHETHKTFEKHEKTYHDIYFTKPFVWFADFVYFVFLFKTFRSTMNIALWRNIGPAAHTPFGIAAISVSEHVDLSAYFSFTGSGVLNFNSRLR